MARRISLPRLVAACIVTAGLSGAAQAALNDRGGGLLYDDVLKVTWLQDANYAATQFAATGGVQGDADGLMNWDAAKTWASNLDISRTSGESLTGWRLAANTPVGADWNFDFSYDGSTDVGFNIISSNSELSYMYYVNLGLKGGYSPTGVYQKNYGIYGNGTTGGEADVGPVKNLQSYVYWSGTAYALFPAYVALFFGTDAGGMGFGDQNFESYAWFAPAMSPPYRNPKCTPC